MKLPAQADLFSDFNGIDFDEVQSTFTSTNRHWSNRLILGDSLEVMTSLAERESQTRSPVHLHGPPLWSQVRFKLAGVTLGSAT